ncbi:hypothetical protein [Ottowia sp.]|uniref:hypothetical protein n=1 Tax=Ottowia sp. TaxID=1898956 RepID=UPI002BF91A69|nr:hypothetical protein [Ottowia sp.]HOB65084.1 hypothetical protein [Ottowia sp.]HPZ56281.1 hypothetical protein [Ottowia sp.]HQD46553.1 hypothetical protein [Ottowia sp.]
MKKLLVASALALAFGAHAQVGTTVKEAGSAAVERTKQAGETVAGAVTAQPKSSVHKAKAQQHKRKAKRHAAKMRNAARAATK